MKAKVTASPIVCQVQGLESGPDPLGRNCDICYQALLRKELRLKALYAEGIEEHQCVKKLHLRCLWNLSLQERTLLLLRADVDDKEKQLALEIPNELHPELRSDILLLLRNCFEKRSIPKELLDRLIPHGF